jgi:hypothetical protein
MVGFVICLSEGQNLSIVLAGVTVAIMGVIMMCLGNDLLAIKNSIERFLPKDKKEEPTDTKGHRSEKTP